MGFARVEGYLETGFRNIEYVKRIDSLIRELEKLEDPRKDIKGLEGVLGKISEMYKELPEDIKKVVNPYIKGIRNEVKNYNEFVERFNGVFNGWNVLKGIFKYGWRMVLERMRFYKQELPKEFQRTIEGVKFYLEEMRKSLTDYPLNLEVTEGLPDKGKIDVRKLPPGVSEARKFYPKDPDQ